MRCCGTTHSPVNRGSLGALAQELAGAAEHLVGDDVGVDAQRAVADRLLDVLDLGAIELRSGQARLDRMQLRGKLAQLDGIAAAADGRGLVGRRGLGTAGIRQLGALRALYAGRGRRYFHCVLRVPLYKDGVARGPFFFAVLLLSTRAAE